MKGTDHGQCLTEETLTEYLEGNLDPVVKVASEVHLVSCSECRERLAFFMRVLQPEVTEEESDSIKVITAQWISRPGNERKPQRTRALFIAVAGAAAVLVFGLLSVQVIRQSAEPKSGTEVVQLLLEQTRPFEARMAAQPHRPLVRTRGTDSEADVSYMALAEEMARVGATNHEMGRFYLLQKNFARAIPYLEIAGREPGAGAAVHNDLGAAYLEGGNASQMERAEMELLQALDQDPSFAPAAFNLALFYERTNATAQAEAQWKSYLELDSGSAWATEARLRLEGLNR